MTYIIHPLTEDEKRRRKAGSDVMEDGEYLHFASVLMRDEASSGNSVFLTDAAAGSIDAALKAAIESAAKSEGLKPSQWLANRNSKQLEDFVAGVAQAHVATLSSAGISKGFNLDHGRALAAARYATDAEAGYRSALADRKAEIRDAWRKPLGAPQLTARDHDLAAAMQRVSQQFTPDASPATTEQTAYDAAKEQRRDEVRNAWKNPAPDNGAMVRDQIRLSRYEG